jgi:hypothetical protein
MDDTAAWGAEDWSALGAMIGAGAGAIAAVAALIALLLAARQLRELIRSNDELARSNDEMSRSNLSLTRPFVVVDFEFERHAQKNPNSGGSSTVFVVVRNVGRTPARDVTMTVDPPFAASGRGQIADEMLPFLNERFSGSAPIKTLAPERPLQYILDDATEAMRSEELPPTYSVVVRYADLSGEHRFEERFELEMGPWRMSRAVEKPLARISKDLQALTDAVRK